MTKHVMLVGLPGAGKSTVGRMVAEQLDAPFADLDRQIETLAGKSVARIFAEDGENAFRSWETLVGARQLAGPPSVVAPGGGYLVDATRREEALRLAYLVYLEVSPAAAAERLRGEAERPLLRGYDPVLRLTQILLQRESGYLIAQGRVTTDGLGLDQVAAQVVTLARSEGGW